MLGFLIIAVSSWSQKPKKNLSLKIQILMQDSIGFWIQHHGFHIP